MKLRAVIVQSTLPNMMITILSIEAGSYPAWLLALLIHPSLDFSEKYNLKPHPQCCHSSYGTNSEAVVSVPSTAIASIC
jgi:hypothetical protein